MRIDIQATSAKLTADEIRRYLPDLKTDGRTLTPWVIGEEGTSRPRSLSENGSRALTWPRRAIQALARAMKTGTKLFVGHGKGTNSHEGRKSVGEVVGTFTRDIGGREQAVAVSILDQDDPALDVCSIEADVDVTGYGEVIDVPTVSALAIESSNRENPAFAGAVRLASLQFFGDNAKEEGRMTFQEVKDWIVERGIAPHRIYDAEDIKADKRIMTAIGPDEDVAGLKAKVEELETANKDLETKAKAGDDARRAVAVSEGRKKLEQALPEGTTEAQKAFLLKEFSPEGENDLTDEALKSYVENGQKRFAEYAKLFGDSDDPKGGSESDDDGGDAGAEDKLLKALTG